MKTKNIWLPAIPCALAMAVLILDTRTAAAGCKAGIELCLQTVIPSLFPFLILSTLLTHTIAKSPPAMLTPLGKFLRLDRQGAAIFTIGLLGGYPIGAQCIAQAHKQGMLSPSDSKRMLAFCSNAGPAFLFGMGSLILPTAGLCWLLWAIHILSAIIVGRITPGNCKASTQSFQNGKSYNIMATMRDSVQVMAVICGWVVLFRVLIAFLQRWFLWLLPQVLQSMLCGSLELANGSLLLMEIENMGTRFVLFSVILAFGGLCVAMQTASVTHDLPHSYYFPGKLAQAGISYLLSLLIQPLIPVQHRCLPRWELVLLAGMILLGYVYLIKRWKKYSSISSAVAV